MNGCIDKCTKQGVKFVKASGEYVEKVTEMCRNVALNMMTKNVEQWELIFPDKDVIKADIAKEHMYAAQTEDNKDIVGCAVMDDRQTPEFLKIGWKYNNGEYVVLRRLMISPEYQGKGIAGELLEYIEKSAAQNNCQSIRIELYAGNKKAIDFYRKRGYNIAGTITIKKGKYYGCEKKLK